MATLSYFKTKFFAAKYFEADLFREAVATIVATILPGGGGKKRKRLTLRGRLSDETIRRLTDKVHEKRRAIWERPIPMVAKESTSEQTKNQVTDIPAVFIDPSIRAEKAQTKAVIANTRAALSNILEEKRREITAKRKYDSNVRHLEVLGNQAKNVVEQLSKEEKRIEADLWRQKIEQDAVIALLLAA